MPAWQPLRRRPVAALLLAAACASGTSGAVAADAAAPQPAVRAEIIDEIVVTARRREERLQDVAISISALSGVELEARQIAAADQLGSVVPNLQFDKAAPSSGSSSVGQIFIRGIGQADFTPVTDPGVALYVDGVYIARSPGNVLDLVDVDRVEVLRGPQGTLFGRNSIGGAIKIHTARPVFGARDATARLRLGNDELRDLTLKANLPISDQAAAKLALNRITRDGYVARPFDGVHTGDRDRWSVRGALLWDVTPDLGVFAVADYSEIDENGAPTVSGGVNDAQPFAAIGNAVLPSCATVTINPAFDGTPQGGPPTFPPPGVARGDAPGCVGADAIDDPFVSGATFPVSSTLESAGVSVELDWSASERLQLKSTTAYRTMSMISSRDGDSTAANIFATRDDYDHEQFTGELQLAMNGDLWSAIVGVFYFDESGFNLVDLTLPLGAIQSGGFYDNRSHALFAHVTADVTDRLSISIGARSTDDRKAYRPDQFVLGDASDGSEPDFFAPTWPLLEGFYLAPTGPLAAGARILLPVTTTVEFDNDDVMVDASYRFSDALMAYASFSTGYKSGGFDQRFVGPTPDGRPSAYFPETVDSIELGLKSTWFGRRLRADLALFDADYDDLQIIVRESFNPLTVNAGAARVRGGELELAWAPVGTLDLTLAIGHVDGDYRRLSQAAQDSGVRLGNRLVNAPQWTVAAGAGLDFDINADLLGTVRVDWSWQDAQYLDAVNSERIRQGPYGVLNASFSVASPDARWRVAIASRNLLDETYLVAGNSAFATAAAYVERVYARPRETIVTLDYRF